MKKVHGTGLVVAGAGAFGIALRPGANPVWTNLDRDMVFNPADRAQEGVATQRIADFEQQGAGQLATLGHHRIIGREFINKLFGPALLDAQHFLDLQPHRIPVFEQHGCVRSNRKAGVLLALKRFGLLVGADQFILIERKDIGSGDGARIAGHGC